MKDTKIIGYRTRLDYVQCLECAQNIGTDKKIKVYPIYTSSEPCEVCNRSLKSKDPRILAFIRYSSDTESAVQVIGKGPFHNQLKYEG